MSRPVYAMLVALLISLVGVACSDDTGPSLLSNNGSGNNENNVTLGLEGDPCTEGSDCSSGICDELTRACTGGSCIDGEQTGDESDVDCGAIGCPRCDIGKACGEDIDCVSGICNDGLCRDKNCADSVKNGLESDVDCGGLCGPCADGKTCGELSDCESLICTEKVCLVPTCEDAAQNGAETDVNCGGPCDPCPVGNGCAIPGDCDSGVCTGGVCAEPNCTDSVANGSETDVDCGGSDCGDCADGLKCSSEGDCQSSVCNQTTLTCSVPSCTDARQNGTETDTDCGGTCFVCDPGRGCTQPSDCASGICGGDSKCTYPACDDGVRNGDETDIDCGGPSCSSCAVNQLCTETTDCTSRVCTNGRCQAGQCDDGQKNGAETDVDCGGATCAPCSDGLLCENDSNNCQSNVCNGNTCSAPTCFDNVKNADESDADCGGGTCTKRCETTEACSFGGDCVSGVCHPTAKTCEPARCDDRVLNGTETDTDCGGSCPRQCSLGQVCSMDIDCNTAVCDGGPIGPICAACRENSTQMLSTRCGFGNRGRVVQTCIEGIWENTECDGVWYGSCKEILADQPQALDGNFAIDPDGPDPLYAPFTVYCDMTTNGGGWTEVLLCTAKNNLRGELVGVDQAQTASFSGCKPFTRDTADGHTYHYTFDFPSGYSQFRFKSYELKANGDGTKNHTADLGYYQTSWSRAQGNNRGDVSFGSAGAPSPVKSFTRALGARSCTDCTLQWPVNQDGPHGVGATSNKFRIGWGESGPEYEGWYPWWDGAIYIR